MKILIFLFCFYCSFSYADNIASHLKHSEKYDTQINIYKVNGLINKKDAFFKASYCIDHKCLEWKSIDNSKANYNSVVDLAYLILYWDNFKAIDNDMSVSKAKFFKYLKNTTKKLKCNQAVTKNKIKDCILSLSNTHNMVFHHVVYDMGEHITYMDNDDLAKYLAALE